MCKWCDVIEWENANDLENLRVKAVNARSSKIIFALSEMFCLCDLHFRIFCYASGH